MARKKTYKGTVIRPFKVGYKEGIKSYDVGDTFETKNKGSLEHLINNKKIEK